MSFPASLTVVTVHGKLLDGAGSPRAGKVIFRTPGFTMSGADDTIVIPRLLAALTDASGAFSIALPATTDPDWTPIGWTYKVSIDLGEESYQVLGDVLVPHDQGNSLSLFSLAPVPSADGQLYALYNDPRFSGTGGGGGGGVTSVFGRSGVVVKQSGDYVKGDVGLGSVDNTSDVNKPVSTAQAAADSAVAAAASTALSVGLGTKASTVHSHAESDVTGLITDLAGLSTAISGKAATAHTHVESDVTSLVSDLGLKAPIASPTFTGTVGGVTAAMVGLGNVTNTSDANKPVSTAQLTALNLKANLAGPTFTGTVAGITSAMVGLGNVDNTADTAKPVSTAQQTALNLKANLASPTFTGTVAGITAAMVSAVPLSVVTAKGDLLVASASGAVSRLGVGADTNVLIADSSQTLGVKWGAGGGGGGTYSLPDGLDPPSNFRAPFPPGRIGSNITPNLAKIYFVPLPIGGTARTLIELAIEVRTAAGAGGLANCSLCSSTTGRLPLGEIANYGTVATDTTGVKAWTISAACAANTLYYAAFSFSVAAGALVMVDAFNPYVAISGPLSGTAAFGAYIMNASLPLGATTFTYFDVDVSFRVTARFS